MCRVIGWVVLFGLASGPALYGAPPTAEQLEFFETRIRPVLIEQCYRCHNSVKQADGELRLDSRAGLLKGGDTGAIIVPGQPAESRLLAILRHEVEGLKMPQGGAKFEDRMISDFEKWIAMGAPDPRDQPPTADELAKATSWEAIVATRKHWWSLRPIIDRSPPVVAGKPWSEHPVDQFILAKLREEKLEPGSRAEAGVLVRRAYFALTGLPPHAAEVERWEARIDRQGGFEELVDELLKAPEFGERWARRWMDWIRYCDSHGSEGDPVIENGWLYRDYLIRALNNDVPYDQLVREHLAGDLLTTPRMNRELRINESLIATAHWRMVFHGFAPTDPLEEKVRFIDDELNTFSKAFLGLTVSCARCHDHKFDAISQQDYYALFGVLSSCRPGRAAIDDPPTQAMNRDELSELKPRIRSALALAWQQRMPSIRNQLLAEGGSWKSAQKSGDLLHAWSLLRKEVAGGMSFNDAWQKVKQHGNTERFDRQGTSQSFGQRWSLGKQEEAADWTRTGAGLGLGSATSAAGEFAVASAGDVILSGIYPAGIYSHRISSKHPSRLTSRDVTLDDDYVVYFRAIGDGATARYVVHDYPRNGVSYPVATLKNEWQWVRQDMSYWKGDVIHLEIAASADGPLLAKNVSRSWFGVRDVVIVKKSDPPPPPETMEFLDPWLEQDNQLPKSMEDAADLFTRSLSNAITAWSNGTMSDAQALLIDAGIQQGLLPNRTGAEELGEQRDSIANLVKEYRRLEEQISTPTRVPGLEEAVARTQPLYIRGNHKQPAEIVPPGFLAVINPQPYSRERPGRLQLADDLLRDDNPLTRRVIVNRLWHHLFGRGLVATPDNFGRLGHAPTHPELLDHLAMQFTRQKFSLKEMIRYLMTSQTWQLTAKSTPEADLRDPDNFWLSHAFVNRLEAEAIRDSLLAVSQELDRTMYGPPVDGNSARRSVYLRVQRNNLDPFLRAFDFPEPFATVGRRDVTNVPAQSLTLMNDPQVSRIAKGWIDRVLADPNVDDDVRIQQMFKAAFARPATTEEVQRIHRFLAESSTRQAEMSRQVAGVKQRIEAQKAAVRSLIDPVRLKLASEAGDSAAKGHVTLPHPISSWNFKDGPKDQVGSADVSLRDGAIIEGGVLVVNGSGYAITAPLEKTLSEKTLEAWVQLDSLEQRSGGVMTVQTVNGTLFDAIVFAEKSPGEWLAGSNVFARTQSFEGSRETDAGNRPVHLAITYGPDGTITGYRDGQPYGKAYRSNGPLTFNAREAVISFGLRHLPAGGNKLLRGRISRANLYDRALSASEVAASSQSAGIVTDAPVLAVLGGAERQKFVDLQQQIARLNAELLALGPVSESPDERAKWHDLARALFTFKEFLFVK